jgi:hypothetical protein
MFFGAPLMEKNDHFAFYLFEFINIEQLTCINELQISL